MLLRGERGRRKAEIQGAPLVLPTVRAPWRAGSVNVHIYKSMIGHTLRQSCLTTGGLAEHAAACGAEDDGLRVRENGRDGEAAWIDQNTP